MKPRTVSVLLIALLVFSAGVRILFFLQVKGTALALTPLQDSLTYHEWALRLVSGDWGWHETYWMGPLYPHVLAVIYAGAGASIPTVLALQLALSLLNVGLVWRVARRAFGTGRKDADAVALIAAALFALYGAPTFYAGTLLMATLATTLLLLAADRALVAAQASTMSAWFRVGLLVGLAGLCRGNNLLLLVALPAVIWVPGGLQPAGSAASNRRTGPRWRATAAMLLGGLLVLAPVTLRNLIVAGDFVLLTSNGGVNLLIGQQADNDGLFAAVVEEPDVEFDPSLETDLEFEHGRDLRGSEVSRILTRRAWREFRDNLDAMPLHYAKKAYRFWNGYELPQVVAYDHWRHEFAVLRLLPVPYVLLSALGLLGLRFLPRPARGVFLALLIGYFLSLWPFFPTSRYRQPLAPLLAVSAAAFVWAMVQAHGYRRGWLAAAVLLVLALLPRWARLNPEEVLWQVQLRQASRACRGNDLAGTLALARAAEQTHPGHPDTPFLLGQYLEILGANAEAVTALQRAEARVPDNRLVPYMIARNLHKLGRRDEALAALDRAAARDPAWPYPWHRRALVLKEQGKPDAALAALARAHELSPGNQRVRANLAAMYAEADRFDLARPLLESLTRDYPRYVNGWFNLALVRYQSGDADGAWAALEQADTLRNLTESQRGQVDQLRTALKTATGPRR